MDAAQNSDAMLSEGRSQAPIIGTDDPEEKGVVEQVRYLKGLGLCLLATFAVSAIGVSAAQAETLEWGSCTAVEGGTGGKYTDAGCTEKAEHKRGAYEWARLPGGEENLEGMTAEGNIVFETAAGKQIECTGLGTESRLHALSPKAAKTPLWIFQGCSSAGQVCTANDNYFGEINNEFAWLEEGTPVPGWTGKLGFISGQGSSSPVVGLEYKALNHERLFEPIACAGGLGTVWIGGTHKGGDSFVSTIGPVNRMTGEFTQTYDESAPGVASVTSFEGKNPVYLEAFLGQHWERVAMVATFRYEPSAEWEIKATR
jgi:hypothetical protein